MIQAISVLAMVCLHLFDRCDFEGLFSPLVFIFGVPLSFYLGQISDFCVMGFAFCSGYGHFKSFNSTGYYKKTLIRLLNLYVNFWIILLLFTVVSVAVGQSAIMPADFPTFIKTFFTVSPAYNGAWWYLPVYALISLASPVIINIAKKLNTVIFSILILAVYCISYFLRIKYVTGNEYIDFFGPFGMTLAEYCFGIICCKINFFEKLKETCGKINNKLLYFSFFAFFIVLLYARTKIIPTLAAAPISGFAIICMFFIIKKPKIIEKSLLFINEHSANIWLAHMFFYFTLFKDFVYIAKYPVLIYIFMLIICIAVSYAVKLVHKPIANQINKLLICEKSAD